MSAANNLADHASQPFTTDHNGTESVMSMIGGPRIRISHEPQLRLQIEELDGDPKEWQFLAYAEEDKGLLESSSQASSHCKSAYLKAIRHNLDIIKVFCSLEIDAEYEFIEVVIVATKKELRRLQRHPELFPNRDIREEFWHGICEACNMSMNTITSKQEARDHVHRMFEAAWLEIEEEKRAPGKDVQRKPWEQFLHNRAPGTEADLSMFPEEGSVQIIPHAAIRILVNNFDEQKAIIQEIEAQREDLKPYAPSSRSYLHSKGLKRSPYGHLRSHRTFTDLLRPTVAGPMRAVRRQDMNSLETLNLDFAALNGQGPPLRSWSWASVVLQERPNSGVESEQRTETDQELMSLFN